MSPVKILVVENEAIVAADLKDHLLRLGYLIVGVCSSFGEALKKITSMTIDLVLIDMDHRGKGGGIEEVLHLKERVNLPIIFLVPNLDSASVARAKGTSALSFLLKPFDECTVELAITTALRNHALVLENDRLSKQLRESAEKVKRLTGLLSICSNCKKIRDQKGYWTRFEVYIENHSSATFAHGICPDCRQGLQKEVDIQM